MNNSKIVLAAVAGAVVGGAIALLFAPRPGKELREKLQDDVMGEIDRFLATVEDKLERFKKEAMAKEDMFTRN